MNIGIPFINKRAFAFNMSQGNHIFQDLLDLMSVKEMKILRKHEDLVDRAMEIAKMTEVQLLAELKEGYSLEIEEYANGDLWISTETLEDSIPNWFSSRHCGWFKTRTHGEFADWARSLLIQDVRIAIWERYLEHKKEKPKVSGHFGTFI